MARKDIIIQAVGKDLGFADQPTDKPRAIKAIFPKNELPSVSAFSFNKHKAMQDAFASDFQALGLILTGMRSLREDYSGAMEIELTYQCPDMSKLDKDLSQAITKKQEYRRQEQTWNANQIERAKAELMPGINSGKDFPYPQGDTKTYEAALKEIFNNQAGTFETFVERDGYQYSTYVRITQAGREFLKQHPVNRPK